MFQYSKVTRHWIWQGWAQILADFYADIFLIGEKSNLVKFNPFGEICSKIKQPYLSLGLATFYSNNFWLVKNPIWSSIFLFCFVTEEILYSITAVRWVSVVEFHDGALGISKVFGQESTVVKWNYQILSLHLVTVHQKVPILDFQSEFSMSKIIRIFLKKIHWRISI